MMFEAWLQLRGEAPEERRIAHRPATATLALTHNLGGYPGEMVSFVSSSAPSPRRSPVLSDLTGKVTGEG